MRYISWNIRSRSFGAQPQENPLFRFRMYGEALAVLPASILESSIAENSATPFILRYWRKLASMEGRSSVATSDLPPSTTRFIRTSSFLRSEGRTMTWIPFFRVQTWESNLPSLAFLTLDPLRTEASISSFCCSSLLVFSISASLTLVSTAASSASVGWVRPSFSGAW